MSPTAVVVSGARVDLSMMSGSTVVARVRVRVLSGGTYRALGQDLPGPPRTERDGSLAPMSAGADPVGVTLNEVVETFHHAVEVTSEVQYMGRGGRFAAPMRPSVDLADAEYHVQLFGGAVYRRTRITIATEWEPVPRPDPELNDSNSPVEPRPSGSGCRPRRRLRSVWASPLDAHRGDGWSSCPT